MRSPEHWDWMRLRMQCEREARRLLPDVHDAEDAVQEAMVRAWRQRHKCRSPEAPLPWVLRITRNEVLRLAGRRRPVLAGAPGAAPEWDLASVDHELEALPVRVDVRRAVSRLSSHDRRLLGLRYGQDMPHNRIAAVLGTPEGTIKVQLHRLRKRLRGDLSGGLV